MKRKFTYLLLTNISQGKIKETGDEVERSAISDFISSGHSSNSFRNLPIFFYLYSVYILSHAILKISQHYCLLRRM